MIRIDSYGDDKSRGYSNKCQVSIGDLTLYFSYRTCVALRYKGELHVKKQFERRALFPDVAEHLGYITGNVCNYVKSDNDGFRRKLKAAFNRTVVQLAKRAIDEELKGGI